jgi:hypothetical protein
VGEKRPWGAAMTKRVLILVEGQTEERFVKDVLGPAFFARNLFFHPTILVTKRVKSGSSFKGGVTSFARFKKDAQRLLNTGSSEARNLRHIMGVARSYRASLCQELFSCDHQRSSSAIQHQ